MASDTLRSASAGAVFGAALTASRVYLPSVIINQMRLRDFHMLEVFLTASAASALIMVVFDRLNIAKPTIRSNSTLNRFGAYDGNIIGGSLLGIGMSLTGACPGTVLPQLAQGVQSARATALGGLLGGIAYAKFGKAIVSPDTNNNNNNYDSASSPTPTKNSPPPKTPSRETIATKFNLPPSTVWLTFELLVLCTIALSTLTLPGNTQTTLTTITGGLLIAAAQALSILLTSTPLGVSAAYEQAGRLLLRDGLSDRDVEPASSPRPPRALVFAAGILMGSLVAGHFVAAVSLAEASVPVPTAQAVLGGFVLTFGARVAGGCTSGHGLSGVASMSYSSLITTAAMFGGGIVAAHLMMMLGGGLGA